MPTKTALKNDAQRLRLEPPGLGQHGRRVGHGKQVERLEDVDGDADGDDADLVPRYGVEQFGSRECSFQTNRTAA